MTTSERRTLEGRTTPGRSTTPGPEPRILDRVCIGVFLPIVIHVVCNGCFVVQSCMT
jgi:hypothetical protein